MPNFNAAFWNWFGKSAVVDADGNPLVVYHGTSGRFNVFDQAAPRVTDTEDFGRAFYFTADKSYARSCAVNAASRIGGKMQVIQAYLSLQNPLIMVVTEEENALTNEDRSYWSEDTRERILALPWTEQERDLLEGCLSEYNDEQFGPIECGIKSERFREVMIAGGHDGFIVNRIILTIESEEDFETSGDKHPMHEIGVFYPSQIKAIDNDGTWDIDDPDILSNPHDLLPKDKRRWEYRVGYDNGANAACSDPDIAMRKKYMWALENTWQTIVERSKSGDVGLGNMGVQDALEANGIDWRSFEP